MAITRWTGDVDGSFTTAGNYTGAAPANGDDVIVDENSSQDINADLVNNTLLLNKLQIAEGATINIGSSGSPLQIASARLEDLGQGNTYYRTATSTSDDTAEIVVEKSVRTAVFELSDDSSSSVIKAIFKRGTVNLAAALANGLTDLIVGRKDQPDSDVDLTLIQGVGNITRGVFNGGKSTIAANIATLFAGGAAHIIYDEDTITTVALLLAGATLEYNSTTTLPLAIGAGGILDFMQDGRNKTVTKIIGVRPFVVRAHGAITLTTDEIEAGVIEGEFA